MNKSKQSREGREENCGVVLCRLDNGKDYDFPKNTPKLELEKV